MPSPPDANEVHSFDPFAQEPAYVKVNEKLVARFVRRLRGCTNVRLLDVAAATGLMTALTQAQARAVGLKIEATLLDIDLPALRQARIELGNDGSTYVYGSADYLPFKEHYDAAFFANSLHLLDGEAKTKALSEIRRVLHDGGLLAVNTTFYDGAYPEESKPFYGRWMRRAIAEVNRRLPQRDKSEKAQAMDWLPAAGYRELLEKAGFKVVEMRERRVLLSQAAVRAISSYKEFAKGALHATDEDAEEAATALQVTVRQTFRDLKMKYLPRNWLEIVAVKA
jgi:ubiquinone/menaquinone biosynthesis C-methylase UbiE